MTALEMEGVGRAKGLSRDFSGSFRQGESVGKTQRTAGGSTRPSARRSSSLMWKMFLGNGKFRVRAFAQVRGNKQGGGGGEERNAEGEGGKKGD